MMENHQITHVGNGEIYDGCLLSNLGSCGPHLPSKESQLVPLSSLNNDVCGHFSSLGVNGIPQDCFKHDITTEKGLICQRANLPNTVSDEQLICPKHRYSFGIYYHPSLLCLNPDHNIKRNKKISCRSVPTNFNNFLQKKYSCHLPVGYKLCTTCRKKTSAEIEHGKDDKDHAEEDTDCYFSLEDVTDSEYRSICYSKDSFNMTISSTDESVSPIKYQLRTPVEEASENTVKSLKRKFSQCISASTDFICDSLAPGQGEELKNLMLSDGNKKKVERLLQSFQV